MRNDAVLFIETTKQLEKMLNSCQSSIKKLVEAQLLSDDDNSNGFEKGCALIRANLGIDPTKGDYEDWAANYAQALWLEKWRIKNHAEMLAKMFGDVK